MINKIMDKLGIVSKKKLEKVVENNHEAMVRLRDRLADKKSENLKLENENLELKDKNRKLEKEYDNYDFRISLVNNKLIKKDNEIKELQEQIKELELKNKYFRNRTKYLGLNDNISFGLSYLLNKKGEKYERGGKYFSRDKKEFFNKFKEVSNSTVIPNNSKKDTK